MSGTVVPLRNRPARKRTPAMGGVPLSRLAGEHWRPPEGLRDGLQAFLGWIAVAEQSDTDGEQLDALHSGLDVLHDRGLQVRDLVESCR